MNANGEAMPTWFEVAPDGKQWVVRFQTATCGRFRTQMEAFTVAVAAARRLKEEGRAAQVRVLRNADQPGGTFIGML